MKMGKLHSAAASRNLTQGFTSLTSKCRDPNSMMYPTTLFIATTKRELQSVCKRSTKNGKGSAIRSRRNLLLKIRLWVTFCRASFTWRRYRMTNYLALTFSLKGMSWKFTDSRNHRRKRTNWWASMKLKNIGPSGPKTDPASRGYCRTSGESTLFSWMLFTVSPSIKSRR